MKLYSENENYKLYQGNMLDMLEVIKPDSIDSIVTDPPYGLTSITKRFGKENSAECQYGKDGSFARLSRGFMGKEWDGSGIEYNIDTWKKCYEVLKPGGYLLAFGGSRTFHRIACAIEDAGFEIRDTIMWLYGCLSNDTEILTSNGWKNSETIKLTDEIYSLDLEKNTIIKNKVKNIFKYDYDGEMVNLKNNNTNQLLTPNHHCIVKDTIKTQIKGKTNYNMHDYWYYKDAWQIRSQTVKLPLASNYNGTLEIGNLFAELLGWVISEGTYLKDTNAIMITQSSVNKEYVKRIRYILGKLKIKYNEYTRERKYKNRTYIEYDFYLGKQAEKYVNKIKKIAPNKKLTWDMLELSLSNKEFLIKGLLQGDGTKDNNSLGFSAFNQKDLEQLRIFQALLHLTNKQGWINENKHSCSIHNNPNTELQSKHFKNRFVKYNGGYVWCVETEIGNFIAKRDGKIFITGNSGFPKSMDISKQIDKRPNKTYEAKIRFGELIKEYRNKSNLTQRQLGELIGVSRELINLYEIKGNNQQQIPTKEQWKKIKKILNIYDDMDYIYEEAEREVIGQKEKLESYQYKNNNVYQTNGDKEKITLDITTPSTNLAKQWQGWGTALKPSFEPIIVARKPFKGSLVDNVIENGVGGINIDECRVAFNGDKWKNQKSGSTAKAFNLNEQQREAGTGVLAGYECKANEQGRFPANTILTYDESDYDEVCGGFPNTKSQKTNSKLLDIRGNNYNNANKNLDISYERGYTDSGSASRYFYCAKASKKDRDEGLDVETEEYVLKEDIDENIKNSIKRLLNL